MVQTYFHHITGMIGCLMGIYFGGYIGSVVHLTTITELSTFNVNNRVLLSLLDQNNTFIYMFNGIVMTITFFLMRVVYYSWILAVKWPQIAMYSYQFWQNYD